MHQQEEERNRQKNLEIIKRFRFIDDTFFAVCFNNDTRLTEFVLRIILDKDDLHVTSVKTQFSIKNLSGHSTVLDAFASDSSGRKYNIEVQRTDTGAVPGRARYYSSLIDGQLLEKNQKYSDLTETYVIFITENDVLGGGLPIYHVERIITEMHRNFDDGAHIVYVNASTKEDSALGRLMHDFMCADPKAMRYSQMAEKADLFKNNIKGVNDMCVILDEVRAEVAAEYAIKLRAAEERAAREKEKAELANEKAAAVKNVIKMLKTGKLTIEEISEISGLSVEDVREYADLMLN